MTVSDYLKEKFKTNGMYQFKLPECLLDETTNTLETRFDVETEVLTSDEKEVIRKNPIEFAKGIAEEILPEGFAGEDIRRRLNVGGYLDEKFFAIRVWLPTSDKTFEDDLEYLGNLKDVHSDPTESVVRASNVVAKIKGLTMREGIFRCQYCGAPYAYRENLEAHERGCERRGR